MTRLTLTITTVRAPGHPSHTVTCELLGSAKQSRQGGTSASAASGQGGWQVVDRVFQKAATEWLDYYPMVLTLSCLVDGGNGLHPASVEPQITLLESFELPVPGSTPPRPPVLTIDGPIQHTDAQWVCSRLELAGGENGAIRDSRTGERTQQYFTVELTEYSPSTASLRGLSPAQAAAKAGVSAVSPAAGAGSGAAALPPSGASGRTYTVRAGDTLSTIAARMLGNASAWTQIASLNGIRDPNVIQPGQVLRLPAASTGTPPLTPTLLHEPPLRT